MLLLTLTPVIFGTPLYRGSTSGAFHAFAEAACQLLSGRYGCSEAVAEGCGASPDVGAEVDSRRCLRQTR